MPTARTTDTLKYLVFAIALLSLLIGCGTSSTGGPPAPSPDANPSTPTASPSTGSPATVLARVIRVIDGDTIDVDLDGSSYRVRYIGIDTPETVHPDKPVQPYGPEASMKNRELVQRKTVRLEKDISETDRYGRLLRYVYVGDMFVNAELVRLGFAQVSTYPPDVKYADLFLHLQREAREAGRGLWAAPTTSPPQKSSPNTRLPLRIVSLTSPVKAGSKATLIAETMPGATVSITVYYRSGPSSAAGLMAKEADKSGRVSWTWTVGSSTWPGTYRIVIATGLVSAETMLIVE